MKRNDYIQEIINRYQSPFYFYDLDQFELHLQKIKATLDPDIKVWYATKANPLSEILRILNKNGFGADVASMGELKQARDSGFGVNNLIATGPAKSKTYLASLMEAGVRSIIIESINQLNDLNEIAGKIGRKQNVLLRIQLDWSGDSSVLGGSSITPFGLGVEDWQEVDLSLYKNIQVEGIHCFQWGNMLCLDKIEAIWIRTMEAAISLSQKMSFDLDILDLGGGLGLSYTDERELDFEDVHGLLVRLKKKYELKEIWLELGRYSIGKFGSYFTKIIDVKSVRGKSLIVAEGGINHMARPALVGEAFPCSIFNNDDNRNIRSYSIHGPLCTALDFLGEFALPESVQRGQWLEFKRAGAYGFSESMPYFLCHNLVGGAFVHLGELMVPRVPKTNLEWMN